MREKLFWIIVTALVVGALILSAVLPKEKPMAIDFGNSFDHTKSITWSNPSSVINLTQKSISMWFILNGLPSVKDDRLFQLDNGTGGWALNSSGGGFNTLYFYEFYSTLSGLWSSKTSLTTGVVYNIIITYDNSSLANNASIYLNNVDDTSATIQHPTGTKNSETGANLAIGNSQYNNFGYPIKILDFKVYNRILSDSERSDMYTSRGASYPRNGLVSCPMLYGAKGLSNFDGALASTNTIYDPCSNTYGVPTGSPIAVPETYLSIR